MPLDHNDLMQLKEDLDLFAARASQGDEVAAHAHGDTSRWLETFALKPSDLDDLPSDADSQVSDGLIDPRVDCVDQTRARMGFVRT